MALDIQETNQEGVVVLTLKGRLTVGESNGLREKVGELVAASRFQVVMDLSTLDYIDSTGLGNLVIYYTTLKKHGGALKLVNLNKRNVELLLLTKLHTVFEVFSDVKDAVNSYFPDRVIQRFDVLSFVQQSESEEN
jgi:anti-sigma B factor antagonist